MNKRKEEKKREKKWKRMISNHGGARKNVEACVENKTRRKKMKEKERK